MFRGGIQVAVNATAMPSLPEVLQEQLGLKREPRKVMVPMLVIDGAD